MTYWSRLPWSGGGAWRGTGRRDARCFAHRGTGTPASIGVSLPFAVEGALALFVPVVRICFASNAVVVEHPELAIPPRRCRRDSRRPGGRHRYAQHHAADPCRVRHAVHEPKQTQVVPCHGRVDPEAADARCHEWSFRNRKFRTAPASSTPSSPTFSTITSGGGALASASSRVASPESTSTASAPARCAMATSV